MTRSDARLSSRGQCDAVGGALLPRSLNKPGRRRTPAAWLRTTCADIRAGKPVARCSCYQVSAIRQSESRGHRGPANRTLSGFLPCSASNGVGHHCHALVTTRASRPRRDSPRLRTHPTRAPRARARMCNPPCVRDLPEDPVLRRSHQSPRDSEGAGVEPAPALPGLSLASSPLTVRAAFQCFSADLWCVRPGRAA